MQLSILAINDFQGAISALAAAMEYSPFVSAGHLIGVSPLISALFHDALDTSNKEPEQAQGNMLTYISDEEETHDLVQDPLDTSDEIGTGPGEALSL